MTNKTLRSLAKDYANGVLDKEAYRNARDKLLQGIVAGKITVDPINYRTPLDIEELDITHDKTAIKAAPVREEPRPTTEIVTPEPRIPAPAPAPAPAPRLSGPPLKLLLLTAIIATLCAIVIVIWYIATNKTVMGITGETDMDSAYGQESFMQPSGAGQLLIEEFLLRNNWNAESLRDFSMKWEALDEAERTAALAGPEKTQLANAIYRQLVEERTLAGLGDPAAAVSRQHALVNFATDLGIEDSRLVVREIGELPDYGTTPAEEVTSPPLTEISAEAAE